jgi:MEMO1 family protein
MTDSTRPLVAGASPRVRPPAVAGTFYPGSPDALRAAIRDAFAGAVHPVEGARVPEALVVPHAGYVYSGPIAASAYARIVPARSTIRRVVLLGPSHRVYVRGLAVSGADAFRTPLGDVPIDAASRDNVLALPGVGVDDRAHADEHSLEVQLPFLQTVLDEFTLLALSVGDASVDQVAAVLDACWGGPETLVVISTDLSHYHRYDDAVRLDARTAAAIVACRPDAVDDRDACGAYPLRGLLRVASDHGLAVEQLDLRNSGDTAGDHHRVVGYGAFALA